MCGQKPARGWRGRDNCHLITTNQMPPHTCCCPRAEARERGAKQPRPKPRPQGFVIIILLSNHCKTMSIGHYYLRFLSTNNTAKYRCKQPFNSVAGENPPTHASPPIAAIWKSRKYCIAYTFSIGLPTTLIHIEVSFIFIRLINNVKIIFFPFSLIFCTQLILFWP